MVPSSLIAVYMDVAVGSGDRSARGSVYDTAWNAKMIGLSFGEQCIVLCICQTMRMLGCLALSFIRSTTLITRILISGIAFLKIVTAANVSSVGVSPQHAITTSGSVPGRYLPTPRCRYPVYNALLPVPWSATAVSDAWM